MFVCFLQCLLVLGLLSQASFDRFDRLNHELLETSPKQPQFQKIRNSYERKYSSSHCFASSFQPDSWRTTSCVFRNLCFNSSSKEFLFYSKSPEDVPDFLSIGVFNMVSLLFSVRLLFLRTNLFIESGGEADMTRQLGFARRLLSLRFQRHIYFPREINFGFLIFHFVLQI